MKILFADAVDGRRVSALESAGHSCRVDPSLNGDSLPSAIDDAEVLVVRSTAVTEATLEAGTSLGMVVRAGAGTDTIDRNAASSRGIYVCNVPGRNAIAVAELTMGLLLAIDRSIADGVADLRAGQWDKARYGRADGLAGKTMAIVGLGDIGLAVAERAKAFGIAVTAVRKDSRSPEAMARIRSVGVRLVDDLDSLLADAQIVSLHVPRHPTTVGLVDDHFLEQLPDGAIVLNTSRGDVVDEEALLRALDQRGMRAGLDVYADEPSGSTGEFRSALASHPRVVGSHHIGASTRQAQESVADGMVEVIEAYAAGGVENCVNLETRALGTRTLSVRHLDEVGVLAKVLDVLGRQGHNVQQMANNIFVGGAAAVATINVDGEPTDAVLDELRAIDEVLAVSTAAMGS